MLRSDRKPASTAYTRLNDIKAWPTLTLSLRLPTWRSVRAGHPFRALPGKARNLQPRGNFDWHPKSLAVTGPGWLSDYMKAPGCASKEETNLCKSKGTGGMRPHSMSAIINMILTRGRSGAPSWRHRSSPFSAFNRLERLDWRPSIIVTCVKLRGPLDYSIEIACS